MPWIVRAIFAIVQTFLDQFQKESNVLLGSSYLDEFDEVIGLENLQELYGGPKPNLQLGDFFPPRFD